MNQREFERGWAFFASDERFPEKKKTPVLGEDTAGTDYDAAYVLHIAWAARILAETQPVKHVDISSYIHFVALVSAFIPIESYEYRAQDLPLSGVTSASADLMNLSFPDNSIKSLSCMHTIEHIGLGRYGDTLDAEGDIKATRELQRVLAPGGDLLVVTPVGRSRLEFNSQRVYSYAQVLKMFPKLDVYEFALIPAGPPRLLRNASPDLVSRCSMPKDPSHRPPHIPSMECTCWETGCGCFWLKKPIVGGL